MKVLIALASLSLLVSCTSFEKEWQDSVATYRSGAITNPSGPWTGSWKTPGNGHNGKLRAIVTPAADAPGDYDFRYKATWAKIMSGGYTAQFPARKRGSTWYVDGAQDLGLFGAFHHKAEIRGDDFEANFSSEKGEIGTFSMKRPE